MDKLALLETFQTPKHIKREYDLEGNNDLYMFEGEEGVTCDLLNTEEFKVFSALPRWYRATVEDSVPDHVILRDAPHLYEVYYNPERGESAGYIKIADTQPHHRCIFSDQKPDVITLDRRLVDPWDWKLCSSEMKNRLIVLSRPGEYLYGVRTSLAHAIDGKRVLWVNCPEDIKPWLKRLGRFDILFRENDS